jgi:hypothetical protein
MEITQMPRKQAAEKNGKSADNIEAHINALPSPQKEIAASLRRVLTTFPYLNESVKGQSLVYALEDGNQLFSIETHPAHAHFKFFKGAALHDPYYLLEGSGKGVRYLTFHTPEDINEEYICHLVAQAIDREIVRH